ncbi:fatty acid amide hydrolase-like [Phalaenopsis equestris]|uniref:fatty acid amide hydrolase-like n=1 Tax=Phalaenopsis equestris TaxID=78828 RepID=UPI0009E38618|nr:fatty acid amide hydrolase-like [Phalaenopsis equestris]
MGLFHFQSRGKIYKPAAEINLRADSDEPYTHANVKAPRVAGFLVKIFVWILESWIIGPAVLYILKKDNLVHKLVSFAEIPESPMFTATHSTEGLHEQEVTCIDPNLSPPERLKEAMDCLPASLETTLETGFKRWTIQDFSRAYSSGETTPIKVAKRFLAALEESTAPHLQMSFFIAYDAQEILKQATESTLRYEKGTPISVLDGVLIAVKDEIDCMPYPTTGGTKWLHKARPCTEDAACIKKLRSCGAIFVGKTNMHELGAGTSGINPHYGPTRNPYNINRVSGGSSSGSAATVCAGLCPVALGVDGGGSVRMPAALCGVVGFKPTSGRFPTSGVIPLNWTVGIPGILAGTVEDVLIVYAAIANDVAMFRPKSLQPEFNLPQLKSSHLLANLKFAKYRKWFNDSSADIQSCCDNALQLLSKHYGWKTVDVTIPEIEEMRLAHYVTIGSESTTYLATHLENISHGELGWDARVALKVYGSFSSRDYLNAQRIRNRQMQFHKEIFKSADVIVTPTTGVTAYPLQRDAFSTGELDYINGAALVRFSIAGNFLGLPAITILAGYDTSGMPIGLQFIGKPWSEATLLHLAYAVQALLIHSYRKPEVFYDLLKTE